MVVPAPVDVEVLARVALFLEAELVQQGGAGNVGRNTARLDPVEALRYE